MKGSTFTRQTRCLFSGLFLLCGGLLLAKPTQAVESFEFQTGFYQGFDIHSAQREFDPHVLTMLFGESQEIERVLKPERTPLFEFTDSIDFHFEHVAGMQQGVLLSSDTMTGVAVVQGDLSGSADRAMLGALDFRPVSTVFISSLELTVVLRASNGDYILLERVAQKDTLNVSGECRVVSAVPEASTLTMLGAGLLGGLAMLRRKRRRLSGGGAPH